LITVTAANKIPYFGSVYVIPTEGPFIAAASLVIHDENGNGQINPTETIDLGVWAKNVGYAWAFYTDGVLLVSDDYVTIQSNRSQYGHIRPGHSRYSNPPYQFRVAEDCPDNHLITFTLEFTDRYQRTWTSFPSVRVSAPELLSVSVDVLNDDNGNGALEPGETADLIVTIRNVGGATATNARSALTTESPYVTVDVPTALFGDIAPGATADNAASPFKVTAHSEAPYLGEAAFAQHVQAGIYETTFDFDLRLGVFVPADGEEDQALIAARKHRRPRGGAQPPLRRAI